MSKWEFLVLIAGSLLGFFTAYILSGRHPQRPRQRGQADTCTDNDPGRREKAQAEACGYKPAATTCGDKSALPKILLGLVGIWIVWFVFLSFRRFTNFELKAVDFDFYDNTIWNTAQGRFFYLGLKNRSYLGIHFSPILLFLVPLYRVCYSPKWLLLIQSVGLGLSSIPLFALARRITRDDLSAFFFSCAWLFAPAIQWVGLSDFHSAALEPILILSLFAALAAGKQGKILLAASLLLLCREDASLLLAASGIYMIARFPAQRRLGTLLAVLGICWWIAATQFWMPFFSGRETGAGYIYSHRYDELGGTYGERILYILGNPLTMARRLFTPDRIFVYLKMFVPFLFVTFLGGAALVPFALTMAMMCLSGYRYQYLLRAHYPAIVYPFLFLASLEGIRFLAGKIKKVRRKELAPGRITRSFALAALTGFVISSFFWGALPFSRKLPRQLLRISPHAYRAQAVLKLIPPEASVATQDSLLPHLAARKSVYQIWGVNQKGLPRFRMRNPGAVAEYIALDRFSGTHPIEKGKIDFFILRLLQEKKYAVLTHADGVFLFKKGPGEPGRSQRVFEESLLRFEVENLHNKTGTICRDPRAGNGEARRAREKKDKKGLLAHGSYLRVPPGQYRAIFRIRGEGSTVILDVSADGGRTTVRRKEISLVDAEADYQEHTVDFELSEKKRIELRIYYSSEGCLLADRIDIRSPQLTVKKHYQRIMEKNRKAKDEDRSS